MEITQHQTTEEGPGGNTQENHFLTEDMMRFFKKVRGDRKSGCWNWTGAVAKDGYSRFWATNKTVQGHRWIYQKLVCPIPDSLELDHLCFNPRCVAPYHLQPVTPTENKRRKALRKAEAMAGRPIRISVAATTVLELTVALALHLPIGGVVVLPARLRAGAVRSTSPAPYGTRAYAHPLLTATPSGIASTVTGSPGVHRPL